MNTVRKPGLCPRPLLAALVASVLMLAACTTGGSEGSGDDTTVEELRVGPLKTQNTLTLASASGRLEAAVADQGGSLTTSSTFPAFAPAAEAIAAGQADMTTGSSTALVTGLQGNPELVIFAVEENDNDTQGIVASAGSGIESVQDLAGHTVAVNEGGTGDYLLRQALSEAGMSIEDVEPVYLGPADAATAFSSGHVDAWATWDQYLLSAQEQDGATLLTLAADIGATNPTVHVVSREFLQARPDLVRAAYEALVEQSEAVIADPQLLIDAYTADGAPTEVAEAIGARRPPSIVPADGDFLAELQAVAGFYAQQGLTSSTTEVTDAVVDVRELE